MNKRAFQITIGAIVIVLAFATFLVATQRTNTFDYFTTMMGVTRQDVSVGSSPSGEFFAEDGMMGIADRSIAPLPPDYPQPTAGKTAAEVDQKVIKTGFLDLVVADVSETASKITALATGKGGFVQTSSVSEREDGTKYGSVTVRVPAKEFEPTISEIKTFATLVQTETASGQDVTEQFTDLQAQLHNAQAQEEEYLRILKQARNVEEILMVQQYLSSIRAQIESLQGRIQYLENTTSYSTISIALSEEPSVRVPTKEFRPLTVVREAFQALVSLGQNLVIALIWIVVVGGGILLPVLLLLLALAKVIWIIVKKFLK